MDTNLAGPPCATLPSAPLAAREPVVPPRKGTSALPAWKRAFDIGLALLLLVPVCAVTALLALVLLAVQGRPVLHRSERMQEPARPFTIWKLRTMRDDPSDRGISGGHKDARVTPFGRRLRRARLDELPQLWNVLRGDMSLVGPRPPLPGVVANFPEVYAEVLKARPGVTGLASLIFCRCEARLLADSRTTAQANAIYARRCVPRKARLDAIYLQRRTPGLDLAILAATVTGWRSPLRPGRSLRRIFPRLLTRMKSLSGTIPTRVPRRDRRARHGACPAEGRQAAVWAERAGDMQGRVLGLWLGLRLGLRRRWDGWTNRLVAALRQGLGSGRERVLACGDPDGIAALVAGMTGPDAPLIVGQVAMPRSGAGHPETQGPVWGEDRIGEALRRTRADRVVLADCGLDDRETAEFAWRVASLGGVVETARQFRERHIAASVVRDLSHAGLYGTPLPRQTAAEDWLLRPHFAGKVVLVTGAGGTIGGEICARLLRLRPARIILAEHGEFALTALVRHLSGAAASRGVTLVPALGSVADPVFVAGLFGRGAPDVVLHAAAYKHVDTVEANPRAGLVNNTIATAILAQKAREAGTATFVLVSTDKAVRPTGLMGASKRMAELVVQDQARRSTATAFCAVRFGNVAGSSGSVLPLFRDQIRAGGPVTLTDPDVTRFFMLREDAAELVLAACAIARGGEIFALDMGPPVRIQDIARGMVALARAEARSRRADPIEITVTGLRPGEKLHETRMVRTERNATVHPRIYRLPDGALSELETAAMLRDLREAVEGGNDAEVIAVVAHWIGVDRRAMLPAAMRTRTPRVAPLQT